MGYDSEGKHVLWEWRTMCLRKQIPRLEPERLFSQLLGKMSAEVKGFKMCFGEEVNRRVWRGCRRLGGIEGVTMFLSLFLYNVGV